MQGCSQIAPALCHHLHASVVQMLDTSVEALVSFPSFGLCMGSLETSVRMGAAECVVEETLSWVQCLSQQPIITTGPHARTGQLH